MQLEKLLLTFHLEINIWNKISSFRCGVDKDNIVISYFIYGCRRKKMPLLDSSTLKHDLTITQMKWW